jgi:hypothetical protein
MELRLAVDGGLYCKLVHQPSGAVLADGFYSYSFRTPAFMDVQEENGDMVVRGRTETGVNVVHRFSARPQSPWMEEQMELSNGGSRPLGLHDARAGFALPLPLAAFRRSGDGYRALMKIPGHGHRLIEVV